MRTSYLILAVVFLTLALFAGACTPTTALVKVGSKVASVVAKPVLGLAVKDAGTTLKWIETELAAGRLNAVEAAEAEKCPLSVIAIDELRNRMAEGATTEEGFKGLIYYGTKNRFGQGVQDEASKHLTALAKSCLPLIPAEKLLKVF